LAIAARQSVREAIPEVRVLLAEDEALVRFAMAEELREIGWEVIEMGTADAAIAAIDAGLRFDLLITDINMPGGTDGIDLARIARDAIPGLRIAIMSGRPQGDIRQYCDLYLEKPFGDVSERFRELLTASH